MARNQLRGRVCQVCSPQGGACFTKRADGYNECNNCGTLKRRRAPAAKVLAAKAESDRKIAEFIAWSEASPTDALRLVPVEPTEAMWQAGSDVWTNHERPFTFDCTKAAFRAMLAAAPASPLPGGRWQDISTAPKDGTCFLWCVMDDLNGNAGMHVVFWDRGEFRYASDHEKFVGDPVDSWIPLPAAPTGEPK